MAEDSEPRIARIRENLVDGLGPFDLMADIIVGSQHGPNNAGLFGIVQSPIRPLRPPIVSSQSSSASSSTAAATATATSTASESRLTAAQMAQKMQKIDAPLSIIETNLPFKKNSERKSNMSKDPDLNETMSNFVIVTSANDNSSTNEKPSTSSNYIDDNSCRKRKRRRSDCSNTDAENWQNPCTSSTTTLKIDDDGSKITLSDLFGEEKGEIENNKKNAGSGLKRMEKKTFKRDKEEQESPDSGFADEISENSREHTLRLRLQNIIGDVGRISPLLTPPRQPHRSNAPTLPVIMNLHKLKTAQMERIKNIFRSVFLPAVPNHVLSPPARPTSRNEQDTTPSLLSCSSELIAVSPKAVLKKANISRSSSMTACNRKQNTHSGAATPSSPSSASTTDLKKGSTPRSSLTSSNNQKQEVTAVKNDDLKLTFIKKFIKQQGKASVALSVPSSNNSSSSSTKESEKRNKKSDPTVVSSNGEQPSTFKQEKKLMQPRFSASDSTLSDLTTTKEKEKKRHLESVHSKEKEKFTTAKLRNNGKQDEQASSCTTTHSGDLKKKQAIGVGVASGVSSNSGNTEDKMVKSSKTRNGEVSPAKKYKKDASGDKNTTADSVQGFSDFICYKSRVAPTKKAVLEKNDDGTFKSATYYLDEVARPLKHRADKESGDHIRKTLAYLDAVVYFILSSAISLGSDARENRQRRYTVARDSAELMKTIIKWSGTSASNLSLLERHYISRLRMLSSRVQAVLNYYLYSLKTGNCMSNFGALTKWEPQLAELDVVAIRNDGAASVTSQNGSNGNTATPSPASSTNSGSGSSERQKEVNVPVFVYQTQRSQLSILHHLMWSDRLWKQTSENMSSLEQEMVKHLDQLCGPLNVDSNLYALSEYLATAVAWLRAEYKAEKERLSLS